MSFKKIFLLIMILLVALTSESQPGKKETIDSLMKIANRTDFNQGRKQGDGINILQESI